MKFSDLCFRKFPLTKEMAEEKNIKQNECENTRS